MEKYYVSYDVGGTYVKFALLDDTGKFHIRGHFATPHNYDMFCGQILKVKHLLEKNHKIEGAGFSIPGATDNRSGIVIGWPELNIFNFPLRQELRKILNMPIAIENDANCAALGDMWLGAGRKFNDMVYIVVGTGVGCALVHNRKILRGSHNMGGELGAMLINDADVALYQTGSTGALVRRFAKIRNVPENTLDGKKIFDLRDHGDREAAQIIDDMYNSLAKTVYNLRFIYDPEAFLLGGAISCRPEFIPHLRYCVQQLHEKLSPQFMVPQILPCHNGNDANLLGALYNLLEHA